MMSLRIVLHHVHLHVAGAENLGAHETNPVLTHVAAIPTWISALKVQDGGYGLNMRAIGLWIHREGHFSFSLIATCFQK